MNTIDNDSTIIYPYCYKIKEDCPPNVTRNINGLKSESDECLELLANYVVKSESPFMRREDKEQAKLELGQCLKKFGDLYNKLDIELYVNPNTKQILFPDQQRIQSSFNEFLRNVGIKVSESPKEDNSRIEKLKIYNMLLNSKFRQIYNDLYVSANLADAKSLKPKEYGISKLMGPDKTVNWSPEVSSEKDIFGGKKRKRRTKRRKNVKSRTKRQKRQKR